MFFTQNYWLAQMGCIHGLENWQIWKHQSQSWNAGGVRQHFNVEPWSAFVEIHWGSGIEAYVSPVSETSINVSLLWGAKRYKPEHGGKKLFCSMLNESPELQDRLNNADVFWMSRWHKVRCTRNTGCGEWKNLADWWCRRLFWSYYWRRYRFCGQARHFC